jgi:putative SOS response-associated peptidase YedK
VGRLEARALVRRVRRYHFLELADRPHQKVRWRARTDANELVAKIHDRMPLILAPTDYVRWLSDETRAT